MLSLPEDVWASTPECFHVLTSAFTNLMFLSVLEPESIILLPTLNARKHRALDKELNPLLQNLQVDVGRLKIIGVVQLLSTVRHRRVFEAQRQQHVSARVQKLKYFWKSL